MRSSQTPISKPMFLNERNPQNMSQTKLQNSLFTRDQSPVSFYPSQIENISLNRQTGNKQNDSKRDTRLSNSSNILNMVRVFPETNPKNQILKPKPQSKTHTSEYEKTYEHLVDFFNRRVLICILSNVILDLMLFNTIEFMLSDSEISLRDFLFEIIFFPKYTL